MPKLDVDEGFDEQALTEEVAAPSVQDNRNIWSPPVASSLTPTSLGSILRSASQQGGDSKRFLTAAEEMEEKDWHYRSVLSTRKLAVAGMPLSITPANDEPSAIAQADFVRELIGSQVGAKTVTQLLDALGKGFSVVEIVWDRQATEWTPKELKWRDPRSFTYDRETGRDLMMRTADKPALGVPLPPYKFIVHEPELKTGIPIRGGLAFIGLTAYMLKGFSLKDWLAFAEVFGMPFRLGMYKANATEEQKNALLDAVRQIGADASAIIPESMEIKFVETEHATGGDKLFQGLADWIDRQISKLVLGQTASTEGTPGRLGNDDTQDKVRRDIKDDDANKLAHTIRCGLVQPIVDLNFGPLAHPDLYPRVQFVSKEKEDLVTLSKALTPFIDRGLPVSQEVILDKFGLPMPDLDDPQVRLLGAQASAQTTTDDEDDEDVDVETARSRAYVTLLRRVEKGETLSDLEREVLVLCAAQNEDEIEVQAKARMEQWRSIMGPVIEPIIQAAENAESFSELQAALGGISSSIDVAEFVRTLAVETFKARGAGDATDRVKL